MCIRDRGIAEDDHLRSPAQRVQKRLCAGQRVDGGNGLLDLLQSKTVLFQNTQAPAHELVIVRLVPGRPLELRDPAGLRKGDPDLRKMCIRDRRRGAGRQRVQLG